MDAEAAEAAEEAVEANQEDAVAAIEDVATEVEAEAAAEMEKLLFFQVTVLCAEGAATEPVTATFVRMIALTFLKMTSMQKQKQQNKKC